MQQFEITTNEAGQRFDKYLHKLMPGAPASFFYKMLRKKNIVLNGKKAEGKEKLNIGDKVSLFLSQETFERFRGECKQDEYVSAYHNLDGIQVLFENEHMALLHKPAGILSQKAKPEDYSVNEWFIGYLLAQKTILAESLETYKPSICNRLDRNTSGIVICAKTLAAGQELSGLIAERKIRKFYRLFVKGTIKEPAELEGYLVKDHYKNKVKIVSGKEAEMLSLTKEEKTSYIQTRYEPIQKLTDMTYLEVELLTGKTHQIRAHLASAGYPLLGDYKYGNKEWNDYYQKKYGIKSQLLHAYRLEIPPNGLLLDGNGLSVTDKEPVLFQKLLHENDRK